MRVDSTDDRDVRDRLRSLRVDPEPGDFERSLRQRLVAAGPPEAASPWRRFASTLAAPSWHAPAVALAAAVVLIIGVTLALPVVRRPLHVTELPATQVAVVRLNLTTDVAVEGAHVTVVLPPQLAFWVDGEELRERTFEWTQPLVAGTNEIPIAVRGQKPGRYTIAVRAHVGDQVVEDRVVLEVTEG